MEFAEKKSILVSTERTFFTLGNEKSRKLLYVFHGYGQLAKFFIQKFKDLKDEFYIVAPEGLAHYYLEGVSGRVGASWMSSEDREKDIANNQHFLDQMHQNLIKFMNFSEINIVSFSQGVPTALRWITSMDYGVNKFLLCSGSIPEDLNLDQLSILQKIQLHYLSGFNDPYRNPEVIKDFYELVARCQLQMPVHEFEGVHELHLPTISSILKY